MRQRAAEASKNEATARDARDKKAQELIKKAALQDGVFAIGGFYIGMPLEDADFLIRYYFPGKKVRSYLAQENIYGYSHVVMENGLWLDDESQCFCRTDKAGKVIRLNFEGEVLDKFFSYGDLTPEKWVQRLAEEKKWPLLGEKIDKTEFKENRIMTIEQPIWHLLAKSGTKMTFFGQEKGKVDESVTVLDFSMVEFMRDYMVQYVNNDGGKVGTLRIE